MVTAGSGYVSRARCQPKSVDLAGQVDAGQHDFDVDRLMLDEHDDPAFAVSSSAPFLPLRHAAQYT